MLLRKLGQIKKKNYEVREEQEDEIIWNFTTIGKYTIASAWKYFIRDGEKATWWKLIRVVRLFLDTLLSHG